MATRDRFSKCETQWRSYRWVWNSADCPRGMMEISIIACSLLLSLIWKKLAPQVASEPPLGELCRRVIAAMYLLQSTPYSCCKPMRTSRPFGSLQDAASHTRAGYSFRTLQIVLPYYKKRIEATRTDIQLRRDLCAELHVMFSYGVQMVKKGFQANVDVVISI